VESEINVNVINNSVGNSFVNHYISSPSDPCLVSHTHTKEK